MPEESGLFSRILGLVEPNTPYLGWFRGGHEAQGVTLCSQHGVPVYAADFFNNATVFAGVREPIADVQPQAPRVEVENKVYVTLTMSEGDNLQYDQHRMRSLWDDPARGAVPINWSICPVLVDAAPAILHYYQRSQTPNDLLVAGPSGIGYTYPGLWPTADLPRFTEATGRYMRRTGTDIIYALTRQGDTNVPLSDAVAQQYQQDIKLSGILYNWISGIQLTFPAGLPVITQIGISSVSEAKTTLAKASSNFDGIQPVFVPLGVLAWNMTPADLKTFADSLDPKYEIVRADVFFDLINQTRGEK